MGDEKKEFRVTLLLSVVFEACLFGIVVLGFSLFTMGLDGDFSLARFVRLLFMVIGVSLVGAVCGSIKWGAYERENRKKSLSPRPPSNASTIDQKLN